MASDSDTLVAPEQAQTASVDSYNEAQLMSFFREIVAKKAGTILFKDALLKAPVPLGAQTLAQIYQGCRATIVQVLAERAVCTELVMDAF